MEGTLLHLREQYGGIEVQSARCLRARYAMPGTDLWHLRDVRYWYATQCAVLPYGVLGRCPVLT
eukprot:414859-Rhodomonas_salina.1